MIAPFHIARLPRIHFGAGSLERVPELARAYGRRALVVSAGASLERNGAWARLAEGLRAAGIDFEREIVRGEPSPDWVDACVARHRDEAIDVVIGIGGGSPLDAAKAVAGLLRVGRSVLDYLEGVGPELPYEGPAVPFIAVPTTAGTGSEATKNAVLSRQGPDGFKKSFRHESLVARDAVVDPELLAGSPRELIAANGMDCLTQLMESYTSSRANPFTDSLVEGALRRVRTALFAWYHHDDPDARADMAYGALISGIALAQTGLGAVHGLASPLGAFFPIPHGVACGTLLAQATEVNLEAMQRREPDNPALDRYARLAQLLTGHHQRPRERAFAVLLETLRRWQDELALPPLSRYGIGEADLPRIVAHSRGSSMKTNPIVLTDEEITAILRPRL